MKRAIIIGALSGIGRELACVLASNGYTLGLVGRRVELLESLRQELRSPSFVKQMDISQASAAIHQLNELIDEMGSIDLLVISAGGGFINTELEWEKERVTIETNVTGFAAMADVAIEHFIRRGSGHLVGLSSVAALRGSGESPAYFAAKAFASNYMEGLRKKVSKLRLPVTVTDIQPGLVDTAMAQGEGLFWVAPPSKAARQIYNAIVKKRKHAYVTRRWRSIAWLLKLLPNALYEKI